MSDLEQRKPDVDAVDRQLVDLLLRDVHASNRELALAVGLSERSVATRLERLRSNNVFAATLVVDWRLIGYEVSCLLLLQRQPRGTKPGWSKAVTARADVQSLTHTVGPTQAVVHVLGRDLRTLDRSVTEIAGLPGTVRHDALVITDYRRYSMDRTPLPLEPWKPDDLPATTRPLDAVDRRIMGCLIADGHRSYRQIGQELGISEATVRMRWKQLEQTGLMRLTTVHDPFAFGEAVMSYFLVRSAAGQQSACREWLSNRPEVVGLMSCLGGYDLAGVAVASAHDSLVAMAAELQASGAAADVLPLPIVGTPFYRLHLARLL